MPIEAPLSAISIVTARVVGAHGMTDALVSIP
jgi:hypothetical protein